MSIPESRANDPIPRSSLTRFSPTSGGQVFVPNDGRRRGLVLVCHERYGLLQHTLDLGRRFANDGFVAIAPDFLFNWDGDLEAVAAGTVIADVGDAELQGHLLAAIDYGLQAYPSSPDRVAVVGVCQSGSYGLLAAEVFPRLAAAVMCYGGIGDREVGPDRGRPYSELLSQVRCPVLGIWGEADHVYSVDHVQRMRRLLEEARISYEGTLFAGMPHGWLNSTMPGRYRPTEGEQAWKMIGSFLERAFAGAFNDGHLHWSFNATISRDYDFTKNVRLA